MVEEDSGQGAMTSADQGQDQRPLLRSVCCGYIINMLAYCINFLKFPKDLLVSPITPSEAFAGVVMEDRYAKLSEVMLIFEYVVSAERGRIWGKVVHGSRGRLHHQRI